MGKAINNLRDFRGGGLDTDSAIEDVQKNDWLFAQNARPSGTNQGEEGYLTNPESNFLITGTRPDGINKGIGGRSFEEIRKVVFFVYNSAGYHQIGTYDFDTKTQQIVFTDIQDTGGEQLFPNFNPQNFVNCILINNTYLVWVDGTSEVGYTNLTTLQSGGYGTVLAEDLSLIKPPCMPPPTGVYGSDDGQPANYLFGLLPQFLVQYVNADFNSSAWSTRSKRLVPYQQNTPTSGADVTKNNYIILSLDIGSIRAVTLNIGCQFDDSDQFSVIKSVDRAYIVALPNTSVDVATEILEAYDPGTNIYSFVFYNNTLRIPITPTETDLSYDYIWPSNAVARIPGNIIGLADFTTQYARPLTAVTVAAVGYNPNIAIPAGTYPDPLTKTGVFPGKTGSGEGDHKRRMSISFGGTPHTGDTLTVVDADIRNSNVTVTYTYQVPSALDGNLAGVAAAYATEFPNSSYFVNLDGTYTITWVDIPYYGLINYAIELFFAGANVANSISTILDNTSYQLALSYRDKWGRYFPLTTDNTYNIATPSYAQVNGNAVEISWTIQNAIAPANAVDYQWLITKPPILRVLDTIATPLNYLGAWDAESNTPTLAVNSGTVGDTYQITVPSYPSNGSGYHDLGGTDDYTTGAYVVYNGQSWDLLPKDFGDLTSTGNILAFSLNSLNLFNSQYATQGVSTILAYDFVPGDRCTLHYYIDGLGNQVFINNPCVNLSVFGYDAGKYLLKVEKSATFDTSVLAGKNVFLRLYSPAQEDLTPSAVENGTLWYEIGERFTITNGNHDVLTGNITDGGAYYKTRQFSDALNPYSSPPIQVLATDLNYSDFYQSAFWSKGRVRSYYDELGTTERKASIIYSSNFILGSKNNGLNRFYPGTIYGDSDGQTSSSYGSIQVMWVRNDILIVLQELHVGYIPINSNIWEDSTGQQTVAIIQKLLGNIRYSKSGTIGIGTAKESFCTFDNDGWFIDPHRSEPVQIGLDGIDVISGKMSKFFKAVIQMAYAQGKKIVMFYNQFNKEVAMCIETESGILTLYPFSEVNWQTENNFVIAGTDVSATPNGAHCTASYNSSTGIVTYTPATNYVGNDVATFTFDPGTGSITLNNCLQWTAGSGDVNPFAFTPIINADLSTLYSSNTIGITGNSYPLPISITGGEYNINGSGWTSASGTVSAGDSVQVRQTSSGSSSTLTTATLTVGGFSADFDVTTKSSSPASTIDINNTTTDFTIAYVKVYIGATIVYTKTNIGPGGSFSDPLPPGTYDVNVKILSSTDGGSGTLTIDSAGTPTTYPVTSLGLTTTQTSVTNPIIVELDP